MKVIARRGHSGNESLVTLRIQPDVCQHQRISVIINYQDMNISCFSTALMRIETAQYL